MGGKMLYRVLGLAFSIPISMAMKKTLDTAWHKIQEDDPPDDPKDPNADFFDILAWAGLSALSLAVGQYVASRASAKTYATLTGRPAPGYDEAA